MKFYHYVILAFLAGGLTYWGRILFLRHTEYYRQRPIVKKAVENIISKVTNHNHPELLFLDPTLDGLIDDIIKVMPYCKRGGFKQKWNECRHDKETYDLIPQEYKESTLIGRRLITERLHNLTSKL